MKERIPICHPDKKYYSKNLCRKCYEKQLKEKNPLYHEEQKKNSREWNKRNKLRRKLYDQERRKFIKQDPYKKYANHIKRKFNFNIDEYEKLIIKQDNKCAICNRSPVTGKKLHLDHCHKTNKIRGLLCAQCNWYLGFIEKDYKILQNILDYLNINLNGTSKEI